MRTLVLGSLCLGVVVLAVGCGDSEGQRSGTYAGNIVTAKNRAGETRTKSDMDAIAAAIDMYATNEGSYPQASGFAAVAAMIEPVYMSRVPLEDAWGRPYEGSFDGQGYRLVSLGQDGQRDTDDDFVRVPGGFEKSPR